MQTWGDDGYPERLRSIAAAPALLYIRGEMTPDDSLSVAIVGTRRATAYGREVTHRLATDLAALGVTVVSGLAKGIDGIAHDRTLAAGGRTIAVLGHGLHTIYPPEHKSLAARIADGNGALITEYPPGAPIDPGNFPARNRIISGLALGVVIVEADRKSGAMITADFAADQGREVFAVPGSILSPMSAGCNALIKDGARLVTGVDDILAELRLGHPPRAARDAAGAADAPRRARRGRAARRARRGTLPHRRPLPRLRPADQRRERAARAVAIDRRGTPGGAAIVRPCMIGVTQWNDRALS